MQKKMCKESLQKANGNGKKKTKRTPKATNIVTTDSPTLSSPGKLHGPWIQYCAFVNIR